MLNPFLIRKYAALLIASFVPGVLLTIGSMFYNFWLGLGLFMIGAILATILGTMFLKNPFTTMLEGKGLLAIDMASPGILRAFNISLKQPYIGGKLGGEDIEDVFDRDAVMLLAPPEEVEGVEEEEEGLDGMKNTLIKDAITYEGKNINIRLSEKAFHRAKFQFNQYPVILFNSQLKTIMTKDFFAMREKDMFANHPIIYLNQKMQELTSIVRDFARYIVEQTRPKNSVFANKWVWVIIIIGIVVLLAIFAKPLISVIQGATSAGGAAIQSAAGAAVTPVG